MAAAYFAYAQAADQERQAADSAADSVVTEQAGASIDAFADYWTRFSGDHLTGLVMASTAVGKSLSEAADAVRSVINIAITQLDLLYDKIQAGRQDGTWPTDPAEYPGYYKVENCRTPIRNASKACRRPFSTASTSRSQTVVSGIWSPQFQRSSPIRSRRACREELRRG
ncbi:hypothetical protein [Streptomyces sp. SID3343]|uniref:hypothetical protein n=1 Tax=Streptomyces sp. SID3343 TaxID=2690260 RepID=UPI00136C3E78|nr:hypothetical protein [Streptomyces sp. SID3343]MYV98856.1 hypothetical protein [Streptomyces sp. SID3343]